ncbi:DHH family phosphoesterase, partial [Bacteriovoracaceae bacterium]|nr:DHH family phosphoesterase [Bacteriovoracaceae bacterium]
MNKKTEPNFENLLQLVDQAETIVITTHIMPDADGIGSQLALASGLASIGKQVVCVNEDHLPPRFDFLTNGQNIMTYDSFKKSNIYKTGIHLFIAVDTHTHERIGSNMRKILQSAKNFVYIDHHPAPAATEIIHCVDTSSAATGELVYVILQKLNLEIDLQMAKAIYMA